jgi:hypothetical protein
MLKCPSNAKDCFESSLILPVPTSVRNSDFGINKINEADFPTNLFQSKDDIRKYMSKNFMRKDDDGPREHPQYALKQVRMTSLKQVQQGIINLSLEAKFLSCMNHPNIIKIRGVAGDPLSPNFGLVLDQLYMTLKEQMDVWAAERKQPKVLDYVHVCLEPWIFKKLHRLYSLPLRWRTISLVH